MDEHARAEQTGAEGSHIAAVRPARHSAPTGGAPLPPVPGTGSRRAAGPRRPPTTGSTRRPATGSRQAARRRRDLRWVPIALAIWVGSFLAIPVAVLVHDALSEEATSVEAAADTSDQGGADQPAAPLTADPASVPAPLTADPASLPSASQRPTTDDGTAAPSGSSDPAATLPDDVPAGVPVAVTPGAGTAAVPQNAPTAISSSTAASSSPATPPTATPSISPVEERPPVETTPDQAATCADCPPT